MLRPLHNHCSGRRSREAGRTGAPLAWGGVQVNGTWRALPLKKLARPGRLSRQGPKRSTGPKRGKDGALHSVFLSSKRRGLSCKRRQAAPREAGMGLRKNEGVGEKGASETDKMPGRKAHEQRATLRRPEGQPPARTPGQRAECGPGYGRGAGQQEAGAGGATQEQRRRRERAQAPAPPGPRQP